MANPGISYEGGCHCGRVRFRVTADLADATVCNCSVCASKGLIHLIVPPERFALLRGEQELTVYRFGTGVAKHQFCRHCGVQPFYVPRSDPDKIDVNARCLDGVDPARLQPLAFDGKNWERTMAARPPAAAPTEGDQTCGQELAADAEVPEALARLMRHVAENMDAHARWVGNATPAAAREQDGLTAVARGYREIADAAVGAAAAMKSMRDVPAAPHDPARLDRALFARWMAAKIEMQRALAALLLRHAEASEQARAHPEGV
jgi:hypothetical protein